jgi:hypothetical protein
MLNDSIFQEGDSYGIKDEDSDESSEEEIKVKPKSKRAPVKDEVM